MQFPFERLLNAISLRTKIIAIANPNSPSGSIATREQIIEIAQRAPQAVVLVDEAYFHFYGETVLDLIGTMPNVVVARTFSKAYGLAGLRLGVLAGPVELMQWMRRVLSPYSVNSLALACLPPALEDVNYLDWYVGEVVAARAEFAACSGRGRSAPMAKSCEFHPGGNRRNACRVCAADVGGGVLVRDRSNDPGCDGCVRITIGTREQMREAVGVLNRTLETLRGIKDGSNDGA